MQELEERLYNLNRYLNDLIDEDVDDCNFYDISKAKFDIHEIELELEKLSMT